MSTPSDSGRAFAPRALVGAEDLDIDFSAPRPHAITQILERCAPRSDVWGWTVPQRTRALVDVALAGGVSSVEALAQCPRGDCGERIEVELDLQSFAPAEDIDLCTVRCDDSTLAVRVPTGVDQRRWLDSTIDVDALPVTLATSLVHEIDGGTPHEGWTLPAAWLAPVESALAEHDPTTDLTIDAVCTKCGDAFAVEIDLEALLLTELSRLQRILLHDVHVLASRYHWSEAQILALPAWRRAFYLAALRG